MWFKRKTENRMFFSSQATPYKVWLAVFFNNTLTLELKQYLEFEKKSLLITEFLKKWVKGIPSS